MSKFKISRENELKVQNYRHSLYQKAEDLFSNHIPKKISQLDRLIQEEALCVSDLSSLHAALDIPIPDPPSPEEEEMETDKNEEEEKKKKKRPVCGFIKGNEKIMKLLDVVKPEITGLKETCITVSCWISLLIPKIEDGNDFESRFRYFTERGDAVAKASKDTHVMDYRSLVHEKDEAAYCEIRVILLDIRGYYAELYDIISKNLEKVVNPKGEEKPCMY